MTMMVCAMENAALSHCVVVPVIRLVEVQISRTQPSPA